MNRKHSDIPAHPRDAAAYWFARVHSGSFTQSDQEAFDSWLQADDLNRKEYQALDKIWQVAGQISAHELRAMLAEEPEPPQQIQKRLKRWRLTISAVAATIIIVIGFAGLFMPYGWLGEPFYTAEYVTDRGERRTEVLPDGSILEINTQTTALVEYFENRRNVRLAGGEVMFSVETDASRPFTVDAGSGTVLVTGTRFNVLRDQDQVQIAVESGSVEISSGHWWNRRTEQLTDGLGAQIDPDNMTPASPADISTLTAWRQGKIIFKDQPLASVIKEMNRYLPQPITITDHRLDQVRIAGVFNTGDSAAFLQALHKSIPVQVILHADGSTELSLPR